MNPSALASRDRKSLGIRPSDPIPDLVAVIEREAGVPVYLVGALGVSGVYLQHKGRPFIFVNSMDAPVRQRFTLAHEYGHHVLNHGIRVDSQIELQPQAAEEAAANAFAAEFLVPKSVLTDWWRHRAPIPVDLKSLILLAARFGVSAPVMCYRLAACRILSPETVATFTHAFERREHLGLNLDLLPDPLMDEIARNDLEVRIPQTAENVFLRALKRELLSQEQAASYLHRPSRRVTSDLAQLQAAVAAE